MTKDKANKLALQEALDNNVSMAVVFDPLSDEFGEGPYFYAPMLGWKMLYPYGKAIEFIHCS